MIVCRNAFLAFLLPILFSTVLLAQERLIPLQSNPAYLNAQKPVYVTAKKALELPFIDDFSTTQVHTDPKLWTDSYVYINTTIAKNPPTMGTASFDGLNGEGQPWSPANVGEEDTRDSQPCDTLTSQPIDLSSADKPEQLYLSFFYQPEGNASKPETGDSLILEAKTKENEWETIWRMQGGKYHDFKSVLIHIGDSTQYIHSDFQFRFINYATPTGYNDFWHIDYVELDERAAMPTSLPIDSNDITYYANETLYYKDFAFVEMPTSIFGDYSEMTFSQFFTYQDSVLNHTSTINGEDTTLNYNHSFTIRNLDFQASNNPDYFYEINILDELVYSKTKQLQSIPSYGTINPTQQTQMFTNNPQEADKILLPGSVFGSDIVELEMKYFFKSSEDRPDERPENDTISRIYTFNNQLAYDDGIVDVGYGVSGEGAQLAQKYKIYQRDFVYGVLIHFARINLNQTDRTFTLKVWESLNGVDGADSTKILATRADLEVVYPDGDNHTGYALYCFEDGIPVQDQFYIGVQQDESVELHFGYDRNNDSSDKLYFNTFNEWLGSAEKGSVMMRPVIGRPLDLENDCNIVTVCPVLGQSCTDLNGNPSVYGEDCTCTLVPVGIFDHPSANLAFNLLPNPANNYVTLQNPNNTLLNNASIEMIDATGKLIKTFDVLNESFYIGDVAVGIYFIKITNQQQQFGIQKLIKTK